MIPFKYCIGLMLLYFYENNNEYELMTREYVCLSNKDLWPSALE